MPVTVGRVRLDPEDKLKKYVFKLSSMSSNCLQKYKVCSFQKGGVPKLSQLDTKNERKGDEGMEAKKEYMRDYMREYMREYREKNREKLNAQRRVWAKNNPEKVVEYQERYWNKKASKEND